MNIRSTWYKFKLHNDFSRIFHNSTQLFLNESPREFKSRKCAKNTENFKQIIYHKNIFSDLKAAQNASEMEAANEEMEATRKLEKFEQPSVEATQKVLETEEAAILPKEEAVKSDELTEEELEHIRRVTEMAMRLEEEEAVMEQPKSKIEQIPSSIFASAKQMATASTGKLDMRFFVVF